MNADEFVSLMSSLNKTDKTFSLGTISSTHTSGRPKVLFDGDTVVSAKQYPYLSSYTPSANDRVLLVNVGGSHVIVGKIV
jgi:hypothetical protein